jgi:hypothetical protein
MNLNDALGHSPEELELGLREQLEGYWIALELYDPHRLPLRKITAVAATPAECFATLKSKGLDLAHFEVVRLTAAH